MSALFLYLVRDRPVVWCHAGRWIERNFVDVAPAPSFGRIIAFDNWVFGCVKVFCRVAIGGASSPHPNMAACTTQT